MRKSLAIAMRKSLAIAMMALALAAAHTWNSAAVAAEVTLKLVSMLPKGHFVGRQFGGFITRLNKEFKGEFQIDWRGGPEVVPCRFLLHFERGTIRLHRKRSL